MHGTGLLGRYEKGLTFQLSCAFIVAVKIN
jgi:hypothetical protein